MGPLVNARASKTTCAALEAAREAGRRDPAGGGRPRRAPGSSSNPPSSRRSRTSPIARDETFAPILYVFEFSTFDEAMTMHNSVVQGLSSAVFTESMPHRRALPLATRARTAASPMSTSAPPGPRSAALSAVRRRPAAAAKPAPTPGRATCAARPAPSTGATSFHWPRE